MAAYNFNNKCWTFSYLYPSIVKVEAIKLVSSFHKSLQDKTEGDLRVILAKMQKMKEILVDGQKTLKDKYEIVRTLSEFEPEEDLDLRDVEIRDTLIGYDYSCYKIEYAEEFTSLTQIAKGFLGADSEGFKLCLKHHKDIRYITLNSLTESETSLRIYNRIQGIVLPALKNVELDDLVGWINLRESFDKKINAEEVDFKNLEKLFETRIFPTLCKLNRF